MRGLIRLLCILGAALAADEIISHQLAGGRALSMEANTLVVSVTDTSGRPVSGLALTARGDSSTGITDSRGMARIRLAPGVKPGDRVALSIVPGRTGDHPWVLISPWDGRVTVPPFQDDPSNTLSL